MKKFLLFLVILIILGGAVFFLGWAQLTIPPGSYGVMRSKTHGLESQVIQDGEFRWFWYKLLPTNVNISAFTLGPVKRIIRSSGSLSSGQVYASLAGLEADFSWEISGEFSFSLKPESLPELAARENISEDSGLRTAEENLATKIENLVLQGLKTYADNGYETESVVYAAYIPELSGEIQSIFPEIENFTLSIKTVRFPDYALYKSVRDLYQEYLLVQNASLSQDITKEAEKRIDLRTRMDELTRYGELLTKYPILLRYLALEKGFHLADE
jgi:hypothetical protein